MSKQNIILGIIFISLLGLAFAYQPLKDWYVNRQKDKNFFVDINFDEINKMEIEGEKKIVLIREGDKWKIDGTKDFYLNEGHATRIKDAFEEAKKNNLDVISENKEKKEQFLTNGKGVRVKLFKDDNLVCDFIVGKLASDFRSTYILKPESNKTYLVKANFNGAFNHDDWYDKTIFSTSKNKITKIRMQYPNREFTIEKIKDGDKEKWEGVLPYKFTVDEKKIDKILDIMTSLRATKIPEQKFEGTGLEKHLIIVEASGDDVDNIIMIGDIYKDKSGKELYYAKKGNSDNIYLITKKQRDELNKTIKDLK